jgi:signal transduction histidine kinase
MIKRLNEIIDTYLINDSIKSNVYDNRKAKVLVYLHLFILLFIALMAVLTYTVAPENKDVPLLSAFIVFSLLLYFFVKKSNLLYSGNLLSGIWFLMLAATVPETGGLNSDNLLWMMITPLVALLFANKRSGTIWLSLLIIYTFSLYFISNSSQNTSENSKLYYLISYTLLFICIYSIVYIFEGGQAIIIKMLRQQKRILEQKNKEIEEKNIELSKLEEKLRLTNQELENFAYAASHDLKEPLRMIKMYTQLTQKRLSDKLDDGSREFMGYVTDGTARMQTLLDDLLQYSRLGRKKDDVKDVDLNNVLFVVVHNLTVALKDNEAAVVANPLPTLNCSSTEMIQLFQNLISNSLKFRKKEEAPKIEIRAKDTGDHYLFTFEDNGIGIKQEYHQKVFNIFERLHTRQEYEGTGIGLATVKKIIQNAGGRIWLSSTEGVGTTFHFTIPKPHPN